jgi:hypothetical protein
MNNFEMALAKQRENINLLQQRWIQSNLAIISATKAFRDGNVDRGIEIIIERAEEISNEIDTGNGSQLDGNDGSRNGSSLSGGQACRRQMGI